MTFPSDPIEGAAKASAMTAWYALMASRDLTEMADVARKANDGEDVSGEPRRILQALSDRGRVEP